MTRIETDVYEFSYDPPETHAVHLVTELARLEGLDRQTGGERILENTRN
jgi:hypothetical protein